MIKESYEEIIELEQQRQNHNVELIASENFPSQRTFQAKEFLMLVEAF